MVPEEHAKALIGYFERCVAETPEDKKWQIGLDTAREWLRLINAATVSPEEVAALIVVVDQFKFKESGWYDLALGVSHWAASSGFR